MLRLSDELWKRATIAAIEAGYHLSDVVRLLLELWLAGKVKLPKQK